MKIQHVANIVGGQDGAIFGDELFRFDHKGNGKAYDLRDLNPQEVCDLTPTATFVLDRADVLVPHANAVCFGTERYEPGDFYPLLYSNVYNNYAKTEDPRMGVCCVYRLQKTEEGFQTKLVQLIEIGFCEDATLWKVSEQRHGVRPYGNFLVDRDTASYYAFVMRDEALGTRYFRFDLPSVHSGEWDSVLGVRRLVLTPADIRAQFDCTYHHFVQGAACFQGTIYSTEGFTNNVANPPAFRVITLATGEERYIDITALGCNEEPEMIDFYNDICYYSDACGKLYRIDF